MLEELRHTVDEVGRATDSAGIDCGFRKGGSLVLARSDAAGVTYELGGPRVWRFRELLGYILKETGRRRPMVDMPMGLARMQARMMELLPGKPLTRDQLLMLAGDNVTGPEMPGLKELGVVPTPVELVVPTYLRRFQPGGGRRPVLPADAPGGRPDLSF